MVGQRQTVGVKIPLKRQKQYFNVAHNIDLGINNDKSNKVNIFGVPCKSNQ